MSKKLKTFFTICLSLCCLHLSFASVAIAQTKIPQSGHVSSSDISFVDKGLEVINDIVFIKFRHFAVAGFIFLGILTLKVLPAAAVCFTIALCLALFPLIQGGVWNLGSSKGILTSNK